MVSEVVRSTVRDQVSDFGFILDVRYLGVLRRCYARSWFCVYDYQEDSCIYNKSSSPMNLAKPGVHQATDLSQPLTCSFDARGRMARLSNTQGDPTVATLHQNLSLL